MRLKRSQIFLSIGLLVFLLVAVLLIKPLRDLPMPNPETASADDFGRYISGRNFRTVSPDARRRFMVEMRKRGLKPEDIAASLPDKEKDNFRRNMEFFKQERLKEFFAMPPEKQQDALKEAAIEMKQNGNRRPADGSTPSHKRSLEGESPEDRARSIEFARRVKSYMDSTTGKK